jgi:hypothetical protein
MAAYANYAPFIQCAVTKLARKVLGIGDWALGIGHWEEPIR